MNRFEDHRMPFEPERDSYRGFDLGEDDEETARGPLILALALGVLIVFAAVVWNTYRQGVREPGEVPLIRAEVAPYKTAGGEPGTGLRDDRAGGPQETFYRQFERETGETGSQLDPGRYKVTAGEAAPEASLQGGPAIDLTDGLGSAASGETARPREDQLRALADLAETLDELGPAPAVSAPAGASRAGSGDPSAPLERTAESPAPPGPAAAIVPAPAPTPATAPAAEAEIPGLAAEGAYLVQLAAYRSAEAADTGWAEFTRRHPALFGETEKRVQRADLAAKGVFYRLRAGAFQSRAHANQFCERLKGEGIDCIVVGG